MIIQCFWVSVVILLCSYVNMESNRIKKYQCCLSRWPVLQKFRSRVRGGHRCWWRRRGQGLGSRSPGTRLHFPRFYPARIFFTNTIIFGFRQVFSNLTNNHGFCKKKKTHNFALKKRSSRTGMGWVKTTIAFFIFWF